MAVAAYPATSNAISCKFGLRESILRRQQTSRLGLITRGGICRPSASPSSPPSRQVRIPASPFPLMTHNLPHVQPLTMPFPVNLGIRFTPPANLLIGFDHARQDSPTERFPIFSSLAPGAYTGFPVPSTKPVSFFKGVREFRGYLGGHHS